MSFKIRPLSVFRIVALALSGIALIMLFLPWLRLSASAMGASVSQSYGVFATGAEGNVASVWSVLLIITAVLAVLAVFVAVFGILTERTIFVLPLPALALLMFILACLQVLHVKIRMKQEMGELSSYVKIHVGVGGWLFLLFSLCAFGAYMYESYISNGKTLNVSQFGLNRSLDEGWTCPSCGTKCTDSQNFCMSCGTPKPAPKLCPHCGKPYKEGSQFCTGCGSRL